MKWIWFNDRVTNTICVFNKSFYNFFLFFFFFLQINFLRVKLHRRKKRTDFHQHEYKHSILCVINPIIFQTNCLSHTGRASKGKIVDAFLATTSVNACYVRDFMEALRITNGGIPSRGARTRNPLKKVETHSTGIVTGRFVVARRAF